MSTISLLVAYRGPGHVCNNICKRQLGSRKGIGRNGYHDYEYCRKCEIFFPRSKRRFCICCGHNLRKNAADKRSRVKTQGVKVEVE